MSGVLGIGGPATPQTPTTQAPSDAPVTFTPSPTTQPPTTQPPTTQPPTTQSPTTQSPTTAAPTTQPKQILAPQPPPTGATGAMIMTGTTTATPPSWVSQASQSSLPICDIRFDIKFRFCIFWFETRFGILRIGIGSVYPYPFGSLCMSNADCQSNLCGSNGSISSMNTCLAPTATAPYNNNIISNASILLANGQMCSSNASCQSGLCSYYSSSNGESSICMSSSVNNLLPLNAPCDYSMNCQSSVCGSTTK